MMNNPNTFQNERPDKLPQHRGGLDPLVILSLIMKYWYFFLIAVILALLGARFYLGHTMSVYMTSTTIQVNETGDRPVVNNDELLQGLGLPGGMRNLENQIMILTSRALTEKVLKELPFEIEYYLKTMRNSISIYPEIPIKVIDENGVTLPKDIEFSILYLGNNSFILTTLFLINRLLLVRSLKSRKVVSVLNAGTKNG
jgi:tyrosine-protein kinase Etk/Wzc